MKHKMRFLLFFVSIRVPSGSGYMLMIRTKLILDRVPTKQKNGGD